MNGFDDVSEVSELDKVVSLQDKLLDFATGGSFEGANSHYQRLRTHVIKTHEASGTVPDFVRRCRDLGQFWQYIKHAFSTYQERREHLWSEFAPLIDTLEFEQERPVDRHVSPVVERFSPEGVSLYWKRALDRLSADPEGAITASKALVESTCKHILDDSGVEYPEHAEITKLWVLVSEELNLAPSNHSEKAFKTILGSCQKIVDTLAELRNKLGDAHGTGRRPVRPKPRHAELAVNLAGSMASFLIATWEDRRSSLDSPPPPH